MNKGPMILAAAVLTLAASAYAAQPVRLRPAGRADALPLKELMGHVMQRNAEQLWAWSAEEVDARGAHSGRPATDEAWEEVESDALTLVELTHVLETPSYRLPAPAWLRYVARARAAVQASARAAEAHDYPALQKAGDDLNAACVACHLHFVPELEKGPPALP